MLKEEILEHQSLKTKLENELPNSICIGAFKINMEKLKKFLVNKRQEIINKLLEMHTKYIRSQINYMLDDFKLIFRRLSVEPVNIEQLFDLRDWMEGVPTMVTEYFENFQKLKMEYDVLDSLLWNIPDEDFECRYETMHYPFLIKNKVNYLLFKILFKFN
jgi:dynein heavy chain